MKHFYANYVKRGADIVLSVILLVLLSPVLLIAIILLFIFNHGQVFFLQERPGLNGELFHVIKLKTMKDDTSSDGIQLTDEKRLTKLGHFLRASSIDELPQFWNVLRGDMSLIGPRPLLKEYLPLYNAFQARRHEVRPGITGWAQVHGRNDISWQRKFELDVWYVDHLTLLTDLKIILLTISHIIRHTAMADSEADVIPFSQTT